MLGLVILFIVASIGILTSVEPKPTDSEDR